MKFAVPHILLAIGAIALCGGAAFRVAITTVPTKAAAATTLPNSRSAPPPFIDSGNYWQHIWTIRAPDCHAVDLSPDGKTVGWLDNRGSVRRVEAINGKTLWQTDPHRDARALSVASSGAVLVYAPLDPANPILRILHPKWGNAHSLQRATKGAIWSVALGTDGKTAWIGSGDNRLQKIAWGNFTAPSASKTAKTTGIPDDLSIGMNGSAAISTAFGAGVAYLSGDGKTAWNEVENEPGRIFRVALSENDTTLAAVSGVGADGHAARITLWEPGTHKLLWTRALNGFAPHVAVSRDGNTIAVGYAAVAVYRTGNRIERKLLVFDRIGRQVAPAIGGPFFEPELIALSDDGSRILVCDERGMIYVLNRSGGFLSRLRPADDLPLKSAKSSRDGKTLLVWRGSDRISLYKTMQ